VLPCTEEKRGRGEEMIDYAVIGRSIGEVVQKKNNAYGDSFKKSGDILKILYPDGIPHREYKTLLTVTRIIDKLFRIATDSTAFDEDPWRDICGYAILMTGEAEQ